MKIKKLIKILLIVVAVVLVWNHLPYRYSNEKAVLFATSHAEVKSKTMCAWYVMRAMQYGGCPIGILPAYAYNKTLPQMGFEEVSTTHYRPHLGDVSVLPACGKSPFGHIAIYDGKQWVSDFRQSSVFPGPTYREVGKYQVFRIEDGWHWKHVWVWPTEWFKWAKALVKGFKYIKF